MQRLLRYADSRTSPLRDFVQLSAWQNLKNIIAALKFFKLHQAEQALASILAIITKQSKNE